MKYKCGVNNRSERDVIHRKTKTVFKFQDQPYLSPNFNDTIFVATPKGVYPKYYIDIKPDKLLDFEFHSQEEYTEASHQTYQFNADFTELKDYTFLELMGYPYSPLQVYDHKSKQTFSLELGTNYPINLFFKNVGYAYGDRTLVMDWDASTVCYTKSKLTERAFDYPDIKRLYDGFTDQDNPVLFFFRLKEPE